MRRGWLLLTLVVVSACSAPQADGLAADVPELPGPGDELPDGLVVPEDAVLLPPFERARPWFEPELAEVSWAVDLALDGDPRVVAQDVVDQLDERGMGLVASCTTMRCSVTGRRSEDGLVLEEVRLETMRTTVGQAGHLHGGTLQYTRWREPGAPHPNPTLGEAPELPRPPLPRATDPPDLPDVGDALPAVFGHELRVADGSAVVAPVEDWRCEDGGFDVHLAVTGDVDEVVDDYEAQVREIEWAELERTDEELLGRPVVLVRGVGPRFDRAQQDSRFELWVAVGEGDEPTWGKMTWSTACAD
jgi:hypothetical protein